MPANDKSISLAVQRALDHPEQTSVREDMSDQRQGGSTIRGHPCMTSALRKDRERHDARNDRAEAHVLRGSNQASPLTVAASGMGCSPLTLDRMNDRIYVPRVLRPGAEKLLVYLW